MLVFSHEVLKVGFVEDAWLAEEGLLQQLEVLLLVSFMNRGANIELDVLAVV